MDRQKRSPIALPLPLPRFCKSPSRCCKARPSVLWRGAPCFVGSPPGGGSPRRGAALAAVGAEVARRRSNAKVAAVAGRGDDLSLPCASHMVEIFKNLGCARDVSCVITKFAIFKNHFFKTVDSRLFLCYTFSIHQKGTQALTAWIPPEPKSFEQGVCVLWQFKMLI